MDGAVPAPRGRDGADDDGLRPCRDRSAGDRADQRTHPVHALRGPIGCQIYTANPDGSAIDQVTDGADSFQGDWSPDATRIAYASFTSGDLAIWIVNADGSDPHQLTPDDPESDDFAPRFTADGQWILFRTASAATATAGSPRSGPDGTGMHVITPNSHDSYNNPEPSPDGTRMAYMRWHVDGVKMAIYVSSAVGSGQHRSRRRGWRAGSRTGRRRGADRVRELHLHGSSGAIVVHGAPDGRGRLGTHASTVPARGRGAAYSPDGQQVIFESDRRYRDFCCHDLYVVPAAGGTPRRIDLPFDAYEARWGTAPTQPATSSARYAMLRFTVGGPPSASIEMPAAQR